MILKLLKIQSLNKATKNLVVKRKFKRKKLLLNLQIRKSEKAPLNRSSKREDN